MISTLRSSSVPFRERFLAVGIGVLFLFYAVGFWGLGFSDHEPWFIALVPFNLLLTNTILFLFHRDWRPSFLLFAFTAWAAGFLFEWVGVHTGLLFGEYTYGAALGFKLHQIPLLIGLNWLMLVYSSGHLVQRFASHWFLRALLGALIMVGLDILIEPVAVRFDFWSWHQNQIPFSNFIGWFVVALLLQMYFHRARFQKDNPIAPWVFGVQVLFFLGLWWVI
ncbi:carotenoid biosynthesis protein [Nibribacter ruber]|uniref:Carotenoid biosynthesis protein n=1 Tax=Nibribacter ruber TaxID=2698458 RepID=A0A6P1P1R6_9BACT|nr:carotenoid biosynthesis protein [Nibribacter ruber]QHL88123.1 carotenoid biosynthesis protein [Nibribacter ruber]